MMICSEATVPAATVLLFFIPRNCRDGNDCTDGCLPSRHTAQLHLRHQ